jgi:uncharacterized protein
MKRSHEPRRLDVAAFAADGATLDGHDAVNAFERLRDVVPEDAPAEAMAWSARGELRRPQAVDPQRWLHLHAHGGVWMTCQRCLQPVRVPVEVDRAVRFVRDEDEAARLDAESDDDVLAMQQPLDLHALIEDEILLALPIVARHDRCPRPLPMAAEAQAAEDAAEHPFATLASLKRRG